MNQKTEQFFPQNSNSQLTYTKRKDSVNNFFEREHNTQINPRIFKYPYLVERSADKFKQDNESNKSTEKRPRRNPYRRKIFDGESAKSSNINLNSLSVDRNRNYQKCNFENNPIRSKLSNKSKNKSRSVYSRSNEQNNFARPISANGQIPVVFHYSTPQSTYYAPIKSTQLYHINSKPFPQAHVVPYPLPNSVPHLIRPSSSFSTQSFPIQSDYSAPSYYLPVNYHPDRLVSQQLPNPIYSKVQTFQKPPKILNHLDGSPSNLPQKNSQSLSFSPFPPSKASPDQGSSSKPIEIRSMNIKNGPMLFLKPQKNTKNDKKPFLREFSQLPSEVHLQNRMVQTFKTGQKFRASGDLNHENFQTRNNSPGKNFKNKNNVSPYNKGLYDQSEIDIHQVDELNAIEDEEQEKYSDRFFDVDFRQAKNHQVHQSEKYCSKSPLLNKISSLNIDKQKIFNQKYLERDGSEKNLKFHRKGTITSIRLGDKKQKNEIKITQNIIPSATKTSNLKNLPSNMDKQGKLITIFLVALGILLVMLQLIK